MKNYIKNNLIKGLTTSPFKVPKSAWLLPLPYLALLLVIGFTTGMLEFGILRSNLVYILPFTMIVMPALLEESVFRGLMVPRDALMHGRVRTSVYLAVSTLLFVIWHPVNALLYNHGAIELFLNPFFLIMVGLLGLACGVGYIVSKSLWVPIIIHWITVMVWVILLGGRNFILDPGF